MRLSICMRTLTRDAISSFNVRIKNKLDSKFIKNRLALKCTRRFVHFHSQFVPIFTNINNPMLYSFLSSDIEQDSNEDA